MKIALVFITKTPCGPPPHVHTGIPQRRKCDSNVTAPGPLAKIQPAIVGGRKDGMLGHRLHAIPLRVRHRRHAACLQP
jgi:hypothetical protein